MPIKGVIFDLDGTLIKTPGIPMFNRILSETLRSLGIKKEQKNMSKIWSSGKNHYKILLEWGVKDIKRFWDEFDKNDFNIRKKMILESKIFPYPDTKVLEELKEEYKLGLVSNASRKVVNLELETFNLKRYFSSIVILGNEKQEYAKPEPYGILLCMEELKLNSHECVYIGDLLIDKIAGEKAGIPTFIVRREENSDTTLQDNPYVIKSLYQIKEKIEKIQHF